MLAEEKKDQSFMLAAAKKAWTKYKVNRALWQRRWDKHGKVKAAWLHARHHASQWCALVSRKRSQFDRSVEKVKHAGRDMRKAAAFFDKMKKELHQKFPDLQVWLPVHGEPFEKKNVKERAAASFADKKKKKGLH